MSATRQLAQVQMKRGSAARAARDLAAAGEAFENAVRLDPASGAAHFNLALVRRDSGRAREAVLEFRAAARLDARDFDAVQNAVLTLGAAVREGGTLFEPRAAAPAVAGPASGVSVIVCSIDAERLARFRANMESHLAQRPHEIIAIGDARSLSEGYGRGLADARHDIVVFAHDDVELISRDPFGEIERALREHDIVGLVGSRRASGPAVLWSGHPHVHGWIVYPARERAGWNAAVMSLESGVLGGMQTLDGVFIAARRDAARAIGFDGATFDGFHFYDLDFTYRAHRAGLKLAVTTGVEAIHLSEGKFEDTWRHYAQRFHAKFPELGEPKSDAHWYGAHFTRREEVTAFFAQLRALGTVP